jgi:hypothetical protein
VRVMTTAVALPCQFERDGRDKPGHDDGGLECRR